MNIIIRYGIYTLILLVYFIFFMILAINFVDNQDINTIYFKIVLIWVSTCALWCTYATIRINKINKQNERND